MRYAFSVDVGQGITRRPNGFHTGRYEGDSRHWLVGGYVTGGISNHTSCLETILGKLTRGFGNRNNQLAFRTNPRGLRGITEGDGPHQLRARNLRDHLGQSVRVRTLYLQLVHQEGFLVLGVEKVDYRRLDQLLREPFEIVVYEGAKIVGELVAVTTLRVEHVALAA